MSKLDELTPPAMRAAVVQKFAVTASRGSTMARSAAVVPAGVAEGAVAPDDPAEGLVGACEKRVLPWRYEIFSLSSIKLYRVQYLT